MLEGDNCCKQNKVEVRGGKMGHRILILKQGLDFNFKIGFSG